jgi:hypothetical protein
MAYSATCCTYGESILSAGYNTGQISVNDICDLHWFSFFPAKVGTVPDFAFVIPGRNNKGDTRNC